MAGTSAEAAREAPFPSAPLSTAGEDVAEGRPSPLIYEEACRRLGASPGACVAIEDSAAASRRRSRPGVKVIAVPRPDLEPGAEKLGKATAVLPDLIDLGPDVVAEVLSRR